MRKLLPFMAMGAIIAAASTAQAMVRVHFVVVDPLTRLPVKNAVVMVQDLTGGKPVAMVTSGDFDVASWHKTSAGRSTTIVLPLDRPISIQSQTEPPTKEIYIKVTATRLRTSTSSTTGATVRDKSEIQKFSSGSGASNANSLVQSQAGVASDSAGQQHVRGEHAEIAYVVDGVPLPDTLSGRQGSIVVPSTVDTLEIIEGGFAPEFGGQTAAVLNVTTTPGSRKFGESVELDGGSYNTFDGDLTAVGPLGKRATYTLDVQGNRTGVYVEPQQPTINSAHNSGSSYSIFSKIRLAANPKDALTLTLSHNPDQYQDSNRTGLPDSFGDVGQGYGFLGRRDANGFIPQPNNPGGLGDGRFPLPSQQASGMDIDSKEINEFAVLNWRRQIDPRTYAQIAVTSLHSGQDVANHNPNVDLFALPIDNSIEYSPSAHRNIHHLQATGSMSRVNGAHAIKVGFLVDRQNGRESYQIGADSQLALDELANLDPILAPAGAVAIDGKGSPVLDVNGNPIYKATSKAIPVLNVSRSGWYDAAYVQDTWKLSKKLTANYGLRYDYYTQSENIQPVPVKKGLISPRINLSYNLDKLTTFRASYDKLFNTPPLAQGAIVGAAIQPETLDQYDASVEHQIGRNQDLKVSYYAKQIRNQVDTALLVPGSQIGLYSAVNFQFGGVHGIEFAYNLYAPHGVGWDGFLNYSYSKAAPNGLDNTGAQVPQYNDHDQRHTLGAGLAYTWKNQASAAITFNYGSGLASSIIRGNNRIPREETDIKYTSSPKFFYGHGGFGLAVQNLFDDRTVINFQSGFSGTRFMMGRRLEFSLFTNF